MADPMETDLIASGSAGTSNKTHKVDRLVEGRDAPWVEKYRPKTLDDVAAHKEIIDTSELAVDLSCCQCQQLDSLQPFSYGAICLFCSQEVDSREQATTLAAVWTTWHRQNLNHLGSCKADIWRRHAEYDVGTECIRRQRHRCCQGADTRFCQHTQRVQVTMTATAAEGGLQSWQLAQLSQM